jgi:hypothetical protein
MGLFGKSRKEVWKQLAKEIDADFIKGRLFQSPRVELKHNNWIICLDTYTVSTGKSSITYTRMRAPLINAKQFNFKIYRKGIGSNIGKALGMQDIEIGYDDWFDRDFIIKSNDEELLIKLLQNHNIRRLIEKQTKIVFELKDNEGRFGPKYNENESVLYFVVVGVIKDKERIIDLYDLFKEVLNEFESIGFTINQAPKVQLYNNNYF